jgi:hypothetical protein
MAVWWKTGSVCRWGGGLEAEKPLGSPLSSLAFFQGSEALAWEGFDVPPGQFFSVLTPAPGYLLSTQCAIPKYPPHIRLTSERSV